MDGIYEWLRNVAVFFLLMTAVLNVLPEAKYRKYVQFFLGLVMLAVLCRPVLALGNLSESLEQALERLTLEEEARGLRGKPDPDRRTSAGGSVPGIRGGSGGAD